MPKPHRIDRDSYEPAYAQLARFLQERIASGEFRPGDRLPSEAQLCSAYAVSPMTVRRAINVLLDRGLVRTVQGLGTFVKPPAIEQAVFSLEPLTALLADEGSTRVRLLEAQVVRADARTARKLDRPEGTRVIFLRRLLLRGDEPLLYHREHLAYDKGRPVVEGELEVTSLRGVLSGSGSKEFRSGELTVEATTLTEEESSLLGGQPGDPAFRLAHTFYDFADRPVSWGWFICRGEVLRFRARVGAWKEGG